MANQSTVKKHSSKKCVRYENRLLVKRSVQGLGYSIVENMLMTYQQRQGGSFGWD